MSGQLTMYTTQWCGFCRNLKRQLARDGIEMAEVDIEHDEEGGHGSLMPSVAVGTS